MKLAAFLELNHPKVLPDFSKPATCDWSHADLELFPGAPISGTMTARYRF
ncbi:MAG TPA: hypothetical protein VF126_08395 [Acidobacteriaceae bacterium]